MIARRPRTGSNNYSCQLRRRPPSPRCAPKILRCPAAFGLKPRLAARLGKLTHTQDVALSLSHRDDTARIEKIENVARLDALVVSRQRHQVATLLAVGPARGEIFLAGRLRHLELLEQHRGVGEFEVVP